MKMNAMESLKDKKMLYLDIVSGLMGWLLYNALVKGLDKSQITSGDRTAIVVSILAVFVSRVIADYGYHSLVSKTKTFGGTHTEFLASAVVWLGLIYAYQYYKNKKIDVKSALTQLACTFIAMLAIAKLTGWA